MYTAKGIAMTDGLNRRNHYFHVSTILNSYEDSIGTPMIMNIGHDRCKPIGYTKLEGVYFEPGKAYLINSFNIAESKEEQADLIKLVEVTDNKTFITERKEKVNQLFSKRKRCNLSTLTN